MNENDLGIWWLFQIKKNKKEIRKKIRKISIINNIKTIFIDNENNKDKVLKHCFSDLVKIFLLWNKKKKYLSLTNLFLLHKLKTINNKKDN